MSSYFRSFFINCEHPIPSTSYHLWPRYVSPCVFLLWTQCYCPHSSLVDTSSGCNQRLSLYVSLSIHLQGYTICGNSGRESNPPFQPTTRLSPKTVSGDRPSTAAVIKPSALSLFLLRKVEFHVNVLQDTHQAATESPVSFGSSLILYLYYIKTRLKCQVFFCFIFILFHFFYYPI